MTFKGLKVSLPFRKALRRQPEPRLTYFSSQVEHFNSKNPDKPSTVRLVQPTAREWSWSHVLSKDPPVYSTADELHERKTEPRRVNVRGILGGSVDFGVHSGPFLSFGLF